MPRRASLWLIAACLGWLSPALALGIETPLPDPQQEALARALFHDIRCVVCQGEAIADSPADVAVDMRRLIREQVAAGKSSDDIKSYLVSRYGNVILMKPPLNDVTSILWYGPLFILAAAFLMAMRYFRKPLPEQPE